MAGIVPATTKALDRAGLGIADIDALRVNESFASVVLALADRDRGADLDKANLNGGAITIGHPLSASGARLANTLLNVLEQREGRCGLPVMCVP